MHINMGFFRIIELEVIQVIILVFLFYLEVISYH